jgi:hypothetical protein
MDDLCNRLMKNPFRRGMYGADPLLAAGGALLQLGGRCYYRTHTTGLTISIHRLPYRGACMVQTRSWPREGQSLFLDEK